MDERKKPILFNQIHINQLPGIPRGLKPITHLSGQINIVAGPNNSGKSSTARLIQQMLWHQKAPQTNAQASLLADNDQWEIKVDGTYVKVQRNGADDQLTGRIPAIEAKSRYMLALHQMVNEEEKDLAKEIIRQTMGGYDLEAAKETLKYEGKIKGKKIAQYKKLTDAISQHRKILNGQKEVKDQEEKLEDLRREKEEADKAREKVQLLEKVMEYHKARNHLSQTEEKRNTFPEEMKNVKGGEDERLSELENEKEDTSLKIQETKNGINRQEKILEKLTIPEKGVSDKTLNELESYLEELKNCQKEVSRLEEQIVEKETEKATLTKEVHPDSHARHWEQFNLKDVSKMDNYGAEALQTIGKKEATQKEVEYLEQELEENTEVTNTDNLKKGLFALTQWLKEPAGLRNGHHSKAQMPRILAGTTVAVTAAAAVALVTLVPGLTGIITGLTIIIAALIITFLPLFRKDKPHKKNIREKDYEETNLEMPQKWDDQHVINRIETITKQLEATIIREKRTTRLKKAKTDLERASKELEEVEKQYDKILEKLKESPLYKNGRKNYQALSYYIKKVDQWQEANRIQISTTEKKKELEKKAQSLLDEINSLLASAGQERVSKLEPAQATYKDIRKQEEDRRTAYNQTTQLKNNLKDLISRSDTITKKQQKVYQELGVEEGNRMQVRKLTELLSSYQDIENKYSAARERLEEIREEIRQHPKRETLECDPLDMENHQAQESLIRHNEMAEKAEKIIHDISSIESQVDSIFNKTDLEQALAKKEQAYTNLQEQYEENLTSITGHLILDKLNRATRQNNQSRVFQKANTLLAQITMGRYELQLDQTEKGRFRAYDTLLKEGQELDKLSSGTRVQLLLAVRLAYVETQEGDYKLPLLADEVLANSDDQRAQALINTLAEVSKTGRQVFFFTAQADEVSKWKTYLSHQQELKYKIIHLETSNKNTTEPFQKPPEPVSLTRKVPKPQNTTHEQYGRLINPEPFQLMTQTSANLHLWYVIEDVNLLFNCMEMGMKYWGMLKTFVESNGKIAGLHTEHFHRMKQQVQTLELFQKLYGKGRPKPINREVLEKSKAVSNNYMEKVSQLLEEVNGNPEKLIDALENQKVSGFRTNKLEDLKQYLLDEGYMDEQQPMAMEDILLRINAYISGKDMKPQDVEPFLKRIVESNYQ